MFITSIRCSKKPPKLFPEIYSKRPELILPPDLVLVCYNPLMPKPAKKHPGRGGHKLSLYPLTPDQATAALLRVKLADVKKLEAEEAQAKGRGKKK